AAQPQKRRRLEMHEFRSHAAQGVDVCTDTVVPPRWQPKELSRPAATLQSAAALLQQNLSSSNNSNHSNNGSNNSSSSNSNSSNISSSSSGSASIQGLPSSDLAAASPQRVRRLAREMGRLLREPHMAYDVFPGVGADALSCWRVIMEGPADSPYAGGCWLLYALFPPEYPNKAPDVRFVTRIRHCNVNAHGRVCHSILDRNWAADTSMATVLNCVYGLLLQPDKHEPVDTSLTLEYHAGGAYEVAIQEHVGQHCKLTRGQWRQKLEEGEALGIEAGVEAPTAPQGREEEGEHVEEDMEEEEEEDMEEDCSDSEEMEGEEEEERSDSDEDMIEWALRQGR
ncbi:unnamed protein product, partial [Polarella glacialis]